MHRILGFFRRKDLPLIINHSALAAFLLTALGSAALADVRLPHIFSSNMVLQRQVAAPVWGWADPGEVVSVSVGGLELKTRADMNGCWGLRLAPFPEGGPYDMIVRGSKNEIKLDNIVIGDVWLCSGESNMRFEALSSSTGKQALAGANLPQLRLFKVPLRAAGQPVQDVDATWQVCTPATA